MVAATHFPGNREKLCCLRITDIIEDESALLRDDLDESLFDDEEEE